MLRPRMDEDLSRRLKQTSMRARVAYAMSHLEASIMHSTSNSSVWGPLLNDMWRYCSDDDLDFWQERSAEYMPSVICGTDRYSLEEFTYLTVEGFSYVKQLYTESKRLLCNMVEWIYDLGTLDMFGLLGSGSGLEEIGKTMDAAHSVGVSSVDVSRFSFSSFSERNGWGEVFDPTEFRAILEHSEIKMFTQSRSVLEYSR